MILISLFKAIQSWFGSWRLIVFHKRLEQMRRRRLTCRRLHILLLFKQLLPRCRLWVNLLPSIGNYSKCWIHCWQVSPGIGSMGKLASSSDYIELPTTTLNSSSGMMVPSTSGSTTYIEMPTTNSSTSTSSGLPTTTSNHTNVTSLHRYRKTV